MRLPHRPLLQTALTTSSIALLAACATNQPFDAAQRAIIKQHTIVTEKLPADYAEPLPVYTKSAKRTKEELTLSKTTTHWAKI